MSVPPDFIRTNVPLAPLTTLAVGGPARFFAAVDSPDALQIVLQWARAEAVPVFVLGGGSNLLVSDEGYAGLILQYTAAATHTRKQAGNAVEVYAEAGLAWDCLVERCARVGHAGIECLSGIPGRVGAVPIQNVGAYGQEIGDTLRSVDAVHVAAGAQHTFTKQACGLGYRTSNFKTHWQNAYVVTGVRFGLQEGLAAPARYPELQKHLAPGDNAPAHVRDAVLTLRRRKSMVWDESDPNHRSAGSFFTNPIVPTAQADALRAQFGDAMPAYPGGDGASKLSAAWLIEHAGLARGYVHPNGKAGLSTNHTLALINRGDATAQDIIEMAAHVRRTVAERFGVTLTPEAQGLGFGEPLAAILGA